MPQFYFVGTVLQFYFVGTVLQFNYCVAIITVLRENNRTERENRKQISLCPIWRGVWAQFFPHKRLKMRALPAAIMVTMSPPSSILAKLKQEQWAWGFPNRWHPFTPKNSFLLLEPFAASTACTNWILPEPIMTVN